MNYGMKDLLGFPDQNEPEEIRPNRAQRRAIAKKLKSRQRRGQRAWNRSQEDQQ